MTPDARERNLVPPAGWLDSVRGGDTGPIWAFLLFATVLGAGLRFFRLTDPSLWVDEILTWQVIRPDLGRSFFEQIGDCIQGPLYMAAAWPLVRGQETELALRLPSLLAGVAAIPVFGVVASRLASRRAALLATVLFALNPFHIWYSQEGRGYAFLVLFTLVAVELYLAMVRDGASPGRTVFFGLALACAGLSNLSAVFLGAGLVLTLLLFDRPDRNSGWGWWALGFGLAAILLAPWLLKASGIWAVARVLPGADGGASLRGDSTFSWLALPYTIQTFFYGYSLGPSSAELHGPDRMALVRSSAWLLGAGAIPVGVGLLVGFGRPGRAMWRQWCWVVVPVGIMVLLAFKNVKPWNPRYVAMVMPWMIILTSRGLVHLPRRAGVALTVLLAGLTLWSLGNYFGSDRYAKADVRAAAAFVAEENTAGDPVLVPVVSGVFDFYYDGPGRTIDTYREPPLASVADADRFIEARLAGAEGCWWVSARSWHFDPDGWLAGGLERTGSLEPVAEFAGTRVWRWQARSPDEDLHER